MKPLQAPCPSCGAPVSFKVGTSLVAICEYCRSVVGRGDKKLEDLGKVADVTDSDSPLDLWIKGRWDGVPYDLTGRVQYAHPAGGFWDEWYAHFANDKWGWIAEAQGRFYITFQEPSQAALPGYEALKLGQPVIVGSKKQQLIVSEKNRAKAIGARGEIPYRLEPNADHPYADLSGPGAAFGTLDYSEEPPLVFVGREVTLDDLGIPKSAKAGQREGRTAAVVGLNCPQCGGALTLRAPDKTERVGCPSCGSLLDVAEGRLKLLQSLHPPKVQPVIPLGSVGEFGGTRFTLLGFMQRSVNIEGEQFFWEEYLLYETRAGFRWLVHSDDHWNFVTPLPPGTVVERFANASYGDKEFKIFQRSRARVEFVLGEFYWKVQAGEEVDCRDFIKPPEMLSEEITTDGKDGEINWSRGLYLPPEEVERAFALKKLPEPTTVAPNQPFPYTPVYRLYGYLVGAAFVLLLVVLLVSPRRKVLEQTIHLEGQAQENMPRRMLVEGPLELQGHRNVMIGLRAPPTQAWVYVEGELTARDTPRRAPFTLLAQNGKEDKVFLNAPPAGTYGLDLRFQWSNMKAPAEAEIQVVQGVTHPQPFFTMLLIMGLVPLGVAIYHAVFESRRWAGSYLGPREEATAEPEEAVSGESD